MKKAVLIMSLIIVTLPLYADDLYLHDNSIIKGEVTGFTAETIRYKTAEGQPAETAKDLVEKIIYSSGKQVEFTDRIFLKDNSVISGKVTGTSGDYTEYNPAGPLLLDRVLTADIIKIVYSNGRVEDFSLKNGVHTIYLRDGRTLRGKDVIIKEKYIEFNNEEGSKETYGTAIIDRIVYSNGETRTFHAAAEPEKTSEKKDAEKAVTPPSGMFMEFEWGWNGYTGLGARFDYMIFDDFSLNGGLGVGFWGYRISGALRYYLEYPYGTAFSLGAAYNTGGELESDYDTTDSSGNVSTEKVTFDLKPVLCINATILYSFMVNGKDKIYLEAGYSYAVQDKKYTYKTENNATLTEESEDIMDIMAPGGIILTVGYAFMF
jgi:opacity protein-like surface antigen